MRMVERYGWSVEVHLLDPLWGPRPPGSGSARPGIASSLGPGTPMLGKGYCRSADAAPAHVDVASGGYVDGPGEFFAASRSAVRSA
jgi:hypothetical protein